jgi:hypothetical protein
MTYIPCIWPGDHDDHDEDIHGIYPGHVYRLYQAYTRKIGVPDSDAVTRELHWFKFGA